MADNNNSPFSSLIVTEDYEFTKYLIVRFYIRRRVVPVFNARSTGERERLCGLALATDLYLFTILDQGCRK